MIQNRELPLVLQATEADVGSVFQTFGDLQGTARHSGSHQGHPGSFVVDFCSIQVGNFCSKYIFPYVAFLMRSSRSHNLRALETPLNTRGGFS